MADKHRTRSQHYAEEALAKINIRKVETDNKLRDEYKSRVDGFPVLVMQAGLAQAVGFMQAKRDSKPGYGCYMDDLASVLGEQSGEAFQLRVIREPLAEYRRLTRETLAVAGWFKRFGQAYLGDKTGNKATEANP